jgi:hypothetical protein
VNFANPPNQQRNAVGVEDDVENLCRYKCISEDPVAIAAEYLKNKRNIVTKHELDHAENDAKNSSENNDVEKSEVCFGKRYRPQNQQADVPNQERACSEKGYPITRSRH